jgi:transposase
MSTHRTQDGTETGLGSLSDLPPVTDLVQKPKLAKLYITALNRVITVPELLDEVDLTKSTVYDYVNVLQNGGLLTTVGEREGATTYTANEFTVTFEIDSTEVQVTPELVRVLSHQDTTTEIQAFVDRYGAATLAEFIDLAYEQAQGGVTTRMIASILDISRGSTYDMLQQIHRILDIGDDGDPETLHADELTANEREELLDRSPRH